MWSWIVPCPDPALLKQRWGGALGVALHTLGRSGLSPGISRVPCTTANVCGTRVAGWCPTQPIRGARKGPHVSLWCAGCVLPPSLSRLGGEHKSHIIIAPYRRLVVASVALLVQSQTAASSFIQKLARFHYDCDLLSSSVERVLKNVDEPEAADA